jgi:hypothetical protein
MHRLLLPPRLWQTELPRFARQRQRCWTRFACFRTAAGPVELIVRDPLLEPMSSPTDFEPFEQALVIEFAERIDDGSADRLLAELDPTDGQVIVAVVLGVGAAAGNWSAAVSRWGELNSLDELQFVGPRMMTLSTNKHQIVDEPDGRWSRTRGALGDQVFERVRRSRIGLIGASRNGSFAAHAFAMLGVRGLVLIDPDRDEAHNVPATLGPSYDGVGDWKVHNRAAMLRRIRPDLEIEPVNREFPDRASLEKLESVDLIVTAADGDLARLAAARWANDHCRPHLDVGTGVFATESDSSVTDQRGNQQRAPSFRKGLDVRLTLPGDACVSCLGGLRDESGARKQLAIPPGMLTSDRRTAWHERRAGSLATLNAIAVNLAIQQWLDLLAGDIRSSRWTRMEWTLDGQLNLAVQTTPNAECKLCRPWHGARENSQKPASGIVRP